MCILRHLCAVRYLDIGISLAALTLAALAHAPHWHCPQIALTRHRQLATRLRSARALADYGHAPPRCACPSHAAPACRPLPLHLPLHLVLRAIHCLLTRPL